MSAPAKRAPAAPAAQAKPVAGPRDPGYRPPYASPTIPDPNYCAGGRFRVFQRADGAFIVYDELAPFGNRTVDKVKSLADAKKAADYLASKAGAR